MKRKIKLGTYSNMKHFKCAILILTIIFVLVLSWHLIVRFSYSRKLPYYSIGTEKDTILTIGIIGDSWVEGQKLDSVVHYSLMSYSIQNKVLSSGQGGARSKQIYRNLCKDIHISYSSKFIIENKPDYCIVVGGTGDATAQAGKNYYTHHLILIIRTLLHYNIKPVIVELPEFGINEFTDDLKLLTKARTRIYSCFTNSGVLDNIQTYRNQFKKTILTQKLNDSIIYIPYNNICSDYTICTDFYSDPLHLSKRGNIVLGKTIVDDLVLKINKSSKN